MNWRRRRLAAFLSVLWLNVAMLPCAMAVEEQPGCPDCPPEHAEAMASHHGHGNSSSCALEQPDCCELDQIGFDSQQQNPGKADSGDSPVEPLPLSAATALKTTGAQYATGPPGAGAGSLRRHVILCVYLD